MVGVGVVLVDEEKQTTMSRVRWDNEEKRHNNQRYNSMALHLTDMRGIDDKDPSRPSTIRRLQYIH